MMAKSDQWAGKWVETQMLYRVGPLDKDLRPHRTERTEQSPRHTYQNPVGNARVITNSNRKL